MRSWLARYSTLNRRRDDRIRRADVDATIIGLKAELNGIRRTLVVNSRERLSVPQGGGFVAPDLAHSVRLGPKLLEKLTGLDEGTIEAVASAYIVIDQYASSLLMAGGRLVPNLAPGRVEVLLPASAADNVKALNLSVAGTLRGAVRKLEARRAELPRLKV